MILSVNTKIFAIVAVISAASVLIGLITIGMKIGWGPFSGLYSLKGEVDAIAQKYDTKRKQEIIFYGASNFRLWMEIENDLSAYKVQNHGFGGSTDKMLVKHAEEILYPYDPHIVFFQTSSNDYVKLSGIDDEKVKACMDYKKEMFETFHKRLPNAKFVVMSGLILPGRRKYTDMTMKINEELKVYCEAHDYMYFVDATRLTYDGKNFNETLFISDGIHLNYEGQLKWCDQYIRPELESLIQKYDLEEVRNKKYS